MSEPSVADDLTTLRRALIAAREFLNRLPLNDGASKRAIDREFIGVKLIPEGLLAADRVEAEIARLEQEWRHAATVASEHLLTAARQQARAEAAEAEVARLTDEYESQREYADEQYRIARAAEAEKNAALIEVARLGAQIATQGAEGARLKDGLRRGIALALAFGGSGAGSSVGEAVPQETWDALFAEGLVRNTTHGVPGADMDTETTSDGADVLRALLAEDVAVMTVADDLARLHLDLVDMPVARERLVRVEAEIARLEQERDDAEAALQGLAQDHYFARAEAAETEVARLRSERDLADERATDYELRWARLRDGLPQLLRWVEIVTKPRVGEGTYAANDDVFEVDGRLLYNLMHAAEPIRALLAEDGAPSVEMYEGDLPTMDGAA